MCIYMNVIILRGATGVLLCLTVYFDTQYPEHQDKYQTKAWIIHLGKSLPG